MIKNPHLYLAATGKPPRCAVCPKPVGWSYRPKAEGGGKVWNRTCGRSCAGVYAQRHQTPELRQRHTERMVAFNREARKRAVIDDVKHAFGEQWKSGDPVTIEQVLAFGSARYRQGWFTREARATRKRA